MIFKDCGRKCCLLSLMIDSVEKYGVPDMYMNVFTIAGVI
jgi:hypothetical protein